MSVERKLFIVLIFLFLYSMTFQPFRFFLLPLILILLLVKTGLRFCVWFLMLVILSFFANHYSAPLKMCGTVSDIREKAAYVRIEGFEYSVFEQKNLSLDDYVCIEGEIMEVSHRSTFVSDPITRWANQRKHIGSIDVKALNVIQKGTSVRSKVFQRVIAIDDSGWLKTFLFAHPAPIVGHFTILFVSGGLIASSMVSMIRKLLGFVFEEKKRQIIMSILLILSVLIWGNSFVCFRLLLSDGIRYSKLTPLARVSIVYSLLLSLFPYHISHPALIIPLTLSLIRIFGYTRFMTRLALLPLIQTWLLYRFDLMSALLFPVFRMAALAGYILSWLCVVYPKFLPYLISFCQGLSFQMFPLFSVFRLTGHPGFIVALIWVFVLLHRRLTKRETAWRLCLMVVLFQLRFYLNPLTTVTFFNVGQADSALIELPFRQGSWLIDTGRPKTSALLRANLLFRGLSHLDAVIISHDDLDHSGGVDMLARDFTVGQWVKDDRHIQSGDFILYSLLKPDPSFDDNDNSLVHLFSVNGFSTLFLADISEEREAELIRKYPFLTVDVIKLAHHGSNTSTSAILLANTQPRLAIISADPRIYGHPHKQTLRSLWQFRVHSISTHRHGDIRISSLGNFHFVMSSSGGFGIMRTVIK